MAKLYVVTKGSPSRKTRKPPSQFWKEMVFISCLLNVLQLVAYILKK